MADLFYVCHWPLSQLVTPGRQQMLGTGPGPRQGVSKSPGSLVTSSASGLASLSVRY